jgi:hypothetical protein
MARRACLAIGVSIVTPPDNQAMSFGYLDGAVFAARAIGEWALRSGFGADNVRVVDDDGSIKKPVTRERVQKAVDELFPQGSEVVAHLILAFCGHGLTDANINSVSWLFGDSERWRYRVKAEEFYAELLRKGVQRITVISDACREAPKDLDLMRWQADRGITLQGTRVASPMFDRFVGCQDGKLGFMVTDRDKTRPGKCIFSGVIADVLWGTEKAAIKDKVITTASFGVCARARTTERGKDYHLTIHPECQIDPEAAVLFDEANPPQDRREVQPWPAAGEATVMGTALPAPAGSDADVTLEMLQSDTSFRNRILGSTFGTKLPGLAISPEALRVPDESKELLQHLVTLRNAPATRTRGGVPGKRQKVEALVQRIESDAVADARKRAAAEVRRSLVQIRPSPGRDGANLLVSGAVARLWSRAPVELGKETAAHMGFRVDSDAQGTPVLVELADGSFTPVVPYDPLYAVVKQSAAGDVLQAYGERNSREAFKWALEAIADFAAGRIGADRIDELAGHLRYKKHVDPALGAICAHLYRAIADFDSIRRMAFFYAYYVQPVPFDIALLGDMTVTRGRNGAPRLHVPAVKARTRRRGGPHLPEFVTRATPARPASIGGRCPWLGLGWDYVGLARPEWAALVDGLADHAPEVRRSGFTVLPKEVGAALAQLWRLQPR